MLPLRILGLAIFLAAFPRLVAAENLPLWMRDVIRVELPPLPAETEVIVLFDGMHTSLDAKGIIRTRYRRVIKVLRESGCALASRLALASGFDTKVRSMTAWNAAPDKKVEKVTMKRVVESQMFADTLYTDAKIRILAVPGVVVGSFVGFEWEEDRTPPSLEDIFEFQGTAPVLRARYSLSLPGGWKSELHWVNWDPQERQTGTEGGSPAEIWEILDIPPLVEEPSRPEGHALAGRLVVRFQSPAEDGRCFAGWRDMGAWYDELSLDALVLTDGLSAKASELTKNASDPWSKLCALADFVQKEIRYVSIQIGIGGFKPHPASIVLRNRFGDCKDKATLMSTLLKALGIASHYLIVHTDRGSVVPDSPVSLYSFNHAILAIALPEDVQNVEMPALLRHPRLGRLLVFDPTFPYTPLGHLPFYLQGNVALLVEGGGGELLPLPLPAPESNLLDREGRFTLSEDGTLEGEILETRRGYLADELRHALLNADLSERTKFLETFLSNFFSGFTLQESRIENLEDIHNDLVLNYKVSVPQYAKRLGDLFIVRPRVLGMKAERLEANDDGPRIYPVALRSTALHRDEFVIGLPSGLKLEKTPPGIDLDAGFATYRSLTEGSASDLVYRREYRVVRPFLPAALFDEAVRFYRDMDKDERQSALLKK